MMQMHTMFVDDAMQLHTMFSRHSVDLGDIVKGSGTDNTQDCQLKPNIRKKNVYEDSAKFRVPCRV